MKANNLPNVLVVSINAWRDNTGINTLIDFFKCWDTDKIAQVYTRTALPNTSVCHHFFRISENAVMKSVFKRTIKTGSIVKNETSDNREDAKTEQNLYSYKGKLSSVFNLCREIVWFCGKWKTKELDRFLSETQIDVLFLPIYPTIYMGRLQKYIIKKTKKPVVSYLADDNYTYKAIRKTPIALVERTILRKYVRFIVKNSSQLMVIAPKQKEEYDKLFGTNSIVMTKGIDFSNDPFELYSISQPIKMVYTGKLIIGRWKSLAAIAMALDQINTDKVKITLDIYTTDILTEEQRKALNKSGCSVKGAVPLDKVRKIQKNADILVFVESLEKKHQNAARLSFSTKITDYLKSGKCIFAIGNRDIAPIDYFNRYDSAITVTDYNEVLEKLLILIDNPNKIEEYGKKAYECGIKHHSVQLMNTLLIDTIQKAAVEGKNGININRKTKKISRA